MMHFKTDGLPRVQGEPMIYEKTGLILTSRQCAQFDTPSSIRFDWADVQVGLWNQCRYQGQIKVNVLQHSVVVLMLAKHRWPGDKLIHALAAAHDLHETFLPDIVRPLKKVIPQYHEWEERWEEWVHRSIGLPWPLTEDQKRRVEEVDSRAVTLEVRNHPDANHFAFHHGDSERLSTVETNIADRWLPTSSIRRKSPAEHMQLIRLAVEAV